MIESRSFPSSFFRGMRPGGPLDYLIIMAKECYYGEGDNSGSDEGLRGGRVRHIPAVSAELCRLSLTFS
jgi:hypothetical protein